MGGPGSGRKKGSGGKYKPVKPFSKKQGKQLGEVAMNLVKAKASPELINATMSSYAATLRKGNARRGGFPGSAIRGPKRKK